MGILSDETGIFGLVAWWKFKNLGLEDCNVWDRFKGKKEKKTTGIISEKAEHGMLFVVLSSILQN
jgi:hypothetical protein